MWKVLDRHIVSKGDVNFPCVPALAGQYASKLLGTWTSLGRAFTAAEAEQLRTALANVMTAGLERAAHALLMVHWEAEPPPTARLNYRLEVHAQTLQNKYEEWVKFRPPPLFGVHPDAKVMSVAAQLGEAGSAPVLDVGAGTGRNALALARLGHPTDAVEFVPSFCASMRQVTASETLPLRIVEGDFLSDEVPVEKAHFRLAVLSEVVTHFRDATEIEVAFSKLADALAPGGILLFNAFIGVAGYEPDTLVQQVAYSSLCSVFSRTDFGFLETDLPFEKVSDESAHDFEKAHLPPSAWPPTSWFVSWSQGRNVFEVAPGSSPMELRWLTYRRR